MLFQHLFVNDDIQITVIDFQMKNNHMHHHLTQIIKRVQMYKFWIYKKIKKQKNKKYLYFFFFILLFYYFIIFMLIISNDDKQIGTTEKFSC